MTSEQRRAGPQALRHGSGTSAARYSASEASGTAWKIGLLVGCLGVGFLFVLFAACIFVPVLLRPSPPAATPAAEQAPSQTAPAPPVAVCPPVRSRRPVVLENLFSDPALGSMGYPAGWSFRREPPRGTYFHRRDCPPEQVAVALQSFPVAPGASPAAALDSMTAELRRTAQGQFPDSRFSTVDDVRLPGRTGRQFACEGPPAAPLHRHFVLLLDPIRPRVCAWCSVLPVDVAPAIHDEIDAMLGSLDLSRQGSAPPCTPLPRLPDDSFGEPGPARPASAGKVF